MVIPHENRIPCCCAKPTSAEQANRQHDFDAVPIGSIKHGHLGSPWNAGLSASPTKKSRLSDFIVLGIVELDADFRRRRKPLIDPGPAIGPPSLLVPSELEFAFEFELEIKQTRVATANANFGNTMPVLAMKPLRTTKLKPMMTKPGYKRPSLSACQTPSRGLITLLFLSGPVAQRLKRGSCPWSWVQIPPGHQLIL